MAASEIVVVMPTTNRKKGNTRSATTAPVPLRMPKRRVDGVMVARVVDEQHAYDGEAAKCVESAPPVYAAATAAHVVAPGGLAARL